MGFPVIEAVGHVRTWEKKERGMRGEGSSRSPPPSCYFRLYGRARAERESAASFARSLPLHSRAQRIKWIYSCHPLPKATASRFALSM